MRRRRRPGAGLDPGGEGGLEGAGRKPPPGVCSSGPAHAVWTVFSWSLRLSRWVAGEQEGCEISCRERRVESEIYRQRSQVSSREEIFGNCVNLCIFFCKHKLSVADNIAYVLFFSHFPRGMQPCIILHSEPTFWHAHVSPHHLILCCFAQRLCSGLLRCNTEGFRVHSSHSRNVLPEWTG